MVGGGTEEGGGKDETGKGVHRWRDGRNIIEVEKLNDEGTERRGNKIRRYMKDGDAGLELRM